MKLLNKCNLYRATALVKKTYQLYIHCMHTNINFLLLFHIQYLYIFYKKRNILIVFSPLQYIVDHITSVSILSGHLSTERLAPFPALYYGQPPPISITVPLPSPLLYQYLAYSLHDKLNFFFLFFFQTYNPKILQVSYTKLYLTFYFLPSEMEKFFIFYI